MIINKEFEGKYEAYKSYYIKKNGLDKYNKIQAKVEQSNKISMLDGASIRIRQAPTAKDYLNTLNSIPYFMFSNNETCALAAMIAIKLWDTRVNQTYHFADDRELTHKLESVLRILKL